MRLLLALGLALPLVAEGNGPDPKLAEAVKAYLAAPDDAGRDAAGKALWEFNDVRVDALSAALHAAVEWPAVEGPIRKKLAIPKGEVEYVAKLPKGYDPKKAYALLYWIMGPGTSADAGFGGWTPEKLNDEYVVVSVSMPADDPDSPGFPNWDTADQTLEAVLDDLLRTVHIDTERVFAGGFSKGGSFTWSFAAFQGDRLAGAVPGAGHPPGEASPHCLHNALWCPFFVVHGDKDRVGPVSLSRDAVAQLKSWGLSPVYKEVRDQGHAWPSQVDDELVKWMSEKRRVRDPKRVFLAVGWWARPERRLYWIAATKGNFQGELEARIDGNTIEVTSKRIEHVRLDLSDRLVDLGKEVVARWNGKEAFRGLLPRRVRLAIDGFRERWDLEDLHDASVVVHLPK